MFLGSYIILALPNSQKLSLVFDIFFILVVSLHQKIDVT